MSLSRLFCTTVLCSAMMEAALFCPAITMDFKAFERSVVNPNINAKSMSLVARTIFSISIDSSFRKPF